MRTLFARCALLAPGAHVFRRVALPLFGRLLKRKPAALPREPRSKVHTCPRSSAAFTNINVTAMPTTCLCQHIPLFQDFCQALIVSTDTTSEREEKSEAETHFFFLCWELWLCTGKYVLNQASSNGSIARVGVEQLGGHKIWPGSVLPALRRVSAWSR